MERIEEVFSVKGHDDQRLELLFTRHGPIVYHDAAAQVALAVRTVFTDPGTAPYMCSLKSMRAQTMPAFRKALETWGAPSASRGLRRCDRRYLLAARRLCAAQDRLARFDAGERGWAV